MAFRLIDISNDEISILFGLLADSLKPHIAIAFSSTCGGLFVPTAEDRAGLRERHEAVKAVCRKAAVRHHDDLADVERLDLNNKRVQVSDCRALADVINSTAMTSLTWLNLAGNRMGSETVKVLAAGLQEGALPALAMLNLGSNRMLVDGARAVGAALGLGALPLLKHLYLQSNGIESAGLIAVMQGLRALQGRPQLETLCLSNNGISDQGVSALLPSLPRSLVLETNYVTDAGCSVLIDAVDAGVGLVDIRLWDNPTSKAARKAVRAATRDAAAREQQAEGMAPPA